MIWGLRYRAVRAQGLLRVLVILIRTNSLHCAAALVHWVLDTGGATSMLKRCSLFERCETLPLSIWSVAHRQSFRCVGGHVHDLTTFTSSERKLSLSATRQPFTVEIALVFVFSLSKSLFFVFFLRLSDLSHTQEQAGNMPLTQAVSPQLRQQRRQWEGVSVRQNNPSPQSLRSPKICERLVITARSTAQSCRSMSFYGRVLAASSRVIAARSEPVYFFRSNLCTCRFRS